MTLITTSKKNYKMTKISSIVIPELKSNRRLINRLGYEMSSHTDTVERWIELNQEDGKLTTAKALDIISEETGLSKKNILEK